MRRRTPDTPARPGRRRLAAALATTVAATGLATILGHSAHAGTGLTARYPAGATTTWFAGRAFDACDAPSRAVMKTWRSSPYGALGIYVRAYLSGWTGTLHAAGYLAGVYGNLSSGMRGLSNGYLDATYTRPDVVWNAHWDGQPNLTGWRGVPDRHWAGHQRVKQYRGDHFESHGGYRVNIDSNALDAPVATVAHPLPITLPKAGDFATATEWAVCRVGTETDAWSRLTDGTYVPDVGLAPGAVTSPLPTCVRPYQVPEDTDLYGDRTGTAAPGVAASRLTRLGQMRETGPRPERERLLEPARERRLGRRGRARQDGARSLRRRPPLRHLTDPRPCGCNWPHRPPLTRDHEMDLD